MRWSSLGTLGLMVALILTACGGGSDAPTARFTIFQYPEEGGPHPVATFEGQGDFATGEVAYTMVLSTGEPSGERREFDGVSYSKGAGADVWYKSEDSAEAAAVNSIRNGLAASVQSLDYLRSVAEGVTEVGPEEVRGIDTVHYRATGHLAELGAPPEFDRFPLEVWIDDSGRTRRLSYHAIGSEQRFVWEFYDFGVSVDLTPPPPGKIR